MDIVLTEWLSAIIRWLHVVAGIAWIGSSFYFIHLDLSLKAREGLAKGVKGEAWQVHGGGFYQMIKFMVAPSAMPDELTWFKWEAYTTWLSGFALLVLVYYFNAELFLIDKSVLDMTAPAAAAVAFGSLLAAWLAYEVLCRSPLGKHEVALALVGFVFLVVLTYGFTRVFSGRGAFTQIGALIGTIMVANVFAVIMPYQRKTVAALMAGTAPDPAWG
ncbi:MAG: urate hydroxylase PuuD, partial [Pseudolabrys sp.]